jgi:hypothetical protein
VDGGSKDGKIVVRRVSCSGSDLSDRKVSSSTASPSEDDAPPRIIPPILLGQTDSTHFESIIIVLA